LFSSVDGEALGARLGSLRHHHGHSQQSRCSNAQVAGRSSAWRE